MSYYFISKIQISKEFDSLVTLVVYAEQHSQDKMQNYPENMANLAQKIVALELKDAFIGWFITMFVGIIADQKLKKLKYSLRHQHFHIGVFLVLSWFRKICVNLWIKLKIFLKKNLDSRFGWTGVVPQKVANPARAARS